VATDGMMVRLHLKRMKVVRVLTDESESLVRVASSSNLTTSGESRSIPVLASYLNDRSHPRALRLSSCPDLGPPSVHG